MKFILLFLLIIIIFAFAITLGSSNDQIVNFNYLIGSCEVRLSTLLAALFGSGFLVGWILTGIFYLRVKLHLSATKRKLTKLQKKHDEVVADKQKADLTNNS
ncbi:lipopolysaccharide assembly protein LapA domain-containing protein [Orbaceae bacterium ESL0721]|nr:lipopolysaccharide assembly protein LapA domain-containing protein [Orbaceae bacterium ESL0721]